MPMDIIVHDPTDEPATETVPEVTHFEVDDDGEENRIILDQTGGRSAEYSGRGVTVSGGTESADDEFNSTLSKTSAWERIKSMGGDKYYRTKTAAKVLLPFHTDVEEAFADQFEHVEHPGLALHRAIYEEQTPAAEARGLPRVPDWIPIMTGEDISAILVEALGGEPGDGVSTGSARRSREAHEQNLKKLRDLIDAPTTEA